MADFTGFSPEVQELLWGIRMNNHREWFDAHKGEYKRVVREPMVAFGEGMFSYFQTLDKDFAERPKVSRPNRDIRFGKNKDP